MPQVITMLPNYLKSMVDTQIAKAKSLQTKNTLSFIYLGDPHIAVTSNFADIATLNYINSRMDIKFTACCGDNLDGAVSKQLQLATAARLMAQLTFHNFFAVKG